LPAAIDGDGGDVEARGIGQRVAAVGKLGQHDIDMAALDDAKRCAAEQRCERKPQHGAARRVALEPEDRAMRRLLARCLHAFTIKCKIFAQQHDRADGGRLQISFWPR
jgi:hypothetical protein